MREDGIMRKTGKIMIGVLALGAAAIVGASVFFYGTFFQKADQTIEMLKELTDGTSFEISADCTASFDATSADAMLLAALIQSATDSEKTEMELVVSGQSTGTDFQLALSAGNVRSGGTQIALTDIVKVGNGYYIGVDKLVSAVTGDLLDSNLLSKFAYESWIKDHYVSWEQLKQLIYDLTGEEIGTGEISVTWADVLMFLCSSDHLFDPNLWSAIQVAKGTDGYSAYRINADYFSDLIGLDPNMISAQLSFCVDRNNKSYDLNLEVTVTDSLGNQIQTLAKASAVALNQTVAITAPKLLLTGDQIDQMKDIIQSILGGL